MRPKKIVFTPTPHRRLNEVIGLVSIAVALLLFFSLLSYNPTDPSLNTAGGGSAHNWTGVAGAWVGDMLLQLFGLTAYLLPISLMMLGVAWLRSRPVGHLRTRLFGLALWMLFAPAMLALQPMHWMWRSAVPVEGMSGRLLADMLTRVLNYPGACIVTTLMVAVAFYLSTTFSMNTAGEWFAVHFAFAQAWRDRWVNWRRNVQAKKDGVVIDAYERKRERALEKVRIAAEKAELKANRAANRMSALNSRAEEDQPVEADTLKTEKRPSLLSRWFARKPKPEPTPDEQTIPDMLQHARAQFVADGAAAAAVSGYAARAAYTAEPVEQGEEMNTASEWAEEEEPCASVVPFPGTPVQETVAGFDNSAISFGERADTHLKAVTITPKNVHGYRLPPSSLLHRSEDQTVVREDALREEARILVEKCAEFDVTGQVTQINPGPVVTTFEFRPEAGVKYSRVTGLAEDLCLAMRAESILIERMAGKSTVGIQVPNADRETIWLRDVIESENFTQSKSRLTLALGKDINGRLVTADLNTMPHVLIAGSTGSGKSVAINAMIMSILYKATPEQVRMILVDPKRVELGMYEGIPHLFTPIITEPKLAANALRNAVREMERRLKLLASRSVRNIEQYNKQCESGTPSLFENAEDQQPLPYIVIIIDELADLMMLDRANVEEAITRLAQMARAVGIHLVLATQRPSVDVITGLIKANVPTRISFRLATKVDSRTILDANGAESLLGRGDMLYLPPGTSRLQRVHAPFVTEKEISAVTDFWKQQGGAEYVPGFLEAPRDAQGREIDDEMEGEGDDDPMFQDGVRLVLEFGKASTSLLQRRLRIGYGRAAHLIDMMERDGIVGPADGSRPREVLKAPDWLNEVEGALR
jgi:S-DNA-T family DNA segregation ATPase FtsK/SpoIIIE